MDHTISTMQGVGEKAYSSHLELRKLKFRKISVKAVGEIAVLRWELVSPDAKSWPLTWVHTCMDFSCGHATAPHPPRLAHIIPGLRKLGVAGAR